MTNKPCSYRPGSRITEEIQNVASSGHERSQDPRSSGQPALNNGIRRPPPQLRDDETASTHLFSPGGTRPGFPSACLKKLVSPSLSPSILSATADHSIQNPARDFDAGDRPWFAASLERRTLPNIFMCARDLQRDSSSTIRAVKVLKEKVAAVGRGCGDWRKGRGSSLAVHLVRHWFESVSPGPGWEGELVRRSPADGLVEVGRLDLRFLTCRSFLLCLRGRPQKHEGRQCSWPAGHRSRESSLPYKVNSGRGSTVRARVG